MCARLWAIFTSSSPFGFVLVRAPLLGFGSPSLFGLVSFRARLRVGIEGFCAFSIFDRFTGLLIPSASSFGHSCEKSSSPDSSVYEMGFSDLRALDD